MVFVLTGVKMAVVYANIFLVGTIFGMLIMYYRLKHLLTKTDWAKDKAHWKLFTAKQPSNQDQA